MIYFKFNKHGNYVAKGYWLGIHYEFQAYNQHAWINFPKTGQAFILQESNLPHFCSFMSDNTAKWLIRKGIFYYIASKFLNV